MTDDAEQHVGNVPRRRLDDQHLELLRASNKLNPELKDREAIAGFTVDSKLNMLENSSVRAEHMKDIASAEEVQEKDYADATLKPRGSIKILKGGEANGAAPVDPEQLRHRNKLHSTASAFV